MPRALNNEIRETSPQLMTLQLTTLRDGDWGVGGKHRGWGGGPVSWLSCLWVGDRQMAGAEVAPGPFSKSKEREDAFKGTGPDSGVCTP